MNKANSLGLSGLIAASVLAIAVPTSVRAADETVLKIGVMGPVTGSQAAVGKDDENGVRLAVEKVNAQKIMVDGKPLRLDLTSMDDAADPRTGVTVAQMMIDQGVKVVLGPYNSGVAMATSKMFDSAGVINAIVATNPQITAQGFKYVFRFAASDAQIGPRVAQFAATQLKLKRIAIIDDRTAYGQGVADSFVAAATADGITVVDREYTSDKAIDFNAVLTKLKQTRPEAIFFGGYYAQAGALIKQMARLAMDQPVLGGDALCVQETVDLAGPAANNKLYCPQGGSVLEASKRGQAFKAEYVSRFKIAPLTFSSSLYDGVMLLTSAIKSTNSVDPVKLRDALQQSDVEGVAGYYSFDDNRDLKHSPITMYTVKKGALAELPGAQ
ncbi:branched-chain amino acid ABC transporter substrate-binding protein [Paraburkholderia sp. BCC1886]|uniref:branched-chain amino acid ABC transporter substrate-binding protein n=1 Tax=Paraburkholderia sp. BCC1886 TaxID=2562670 RepID=UPI0021B3C7D3|nr:branched-chain amino acid ABC transporter substrate-binding protein [Paraburkholderia sp. BCC1886]